MPLQPKDRSSIWKSKELVHNRPAKDHLNGSPVLCALIRYFRHPLRHAPLGQTLIVTSGCGWAQREGGPKEEIRPGDVIWFPPGEKHWHGATATTAMTHIAIQEALDGKPVDWMEHVSDEQYQG
jgi:quercetin dioxygenase-like cupin family protein